MSIAQRNKLWILSITGKNIVNFFDQALNNRKFWRLSAEKSRIPSIMWIKCEFCQLLSEKYREFCQSPVGEKTEFRHSLLEKKCKFRLSFAEINWRISSIPATKVLNFVHLSQEKKSRISTEKMTNFVDLEQIVAFYLGGEESRISSITCGKSSEYCQSFLEKKTKTFSSVSENREFRRSVAGK